MGDQGQDALFLQLREGLPDEVRLVRGRKLDQHIGGIAHAELLGVQRTELGRKVDLAAQLEAELHGFRLLLQSRRQGLKRLRALLEKVLHGRPLTVEMAGEGEVPDAVCIFFPEQL